MDEDETLERAKVTDQSHLIIQDTFSGGDTLEMDDADGDEVDGLTAYEREQEAAANAGGWDEEEEDNDGDEGDNWGDDGDEY